MQKSQTLVAFGATTQLAMMIALTAGTLAASTPLSAPSIDIVVARYQESIAWTSTYSDQVTAAQSQAPAKAPCAPPAHEPDRQPAHLIRPACFHSGKSHRVRQKLVSGAWIHPSGKRWARVSHLPASHRLQVRRGGAGGLDSLHAGGRTILRVQGPPLRWRPPRWWCVL